MEDQNDNETGRGRGKGRRLINHDFRKNWDESDNDDEKIDEMDKTASRFACKYLKSESKNKIKKEA